MNAEFLVDLLCCVLRGTGSGVVVVAGDGVNIWSQLSYGLFSMQLSQETRVLAEFDGINWDLGLLRMRVVRGNVHTRILHGWGPGYGGGGGGGGGQAR